MFRNIINHLNQTNQINIVYCEIPQCDCNVDRNAADVPAASLSGPMCRAGLQVTQQRSDPPQRNLRRHIAPGSALRPCVLGTARGIHAREIR